VNALQLNDMRAVVLTGHGGYECLSFRDDVPVPSPTSDEVLIRVAAAGVNNTDINTRLGWYVGGGWTGSFQFPRIQGIDGCGHIVAVGDAGDASRIGQRVVVEPCWRGADNSLAGARFFGSEVDGAFAEFTVVPARYAHTVNSALSDVELASFPCSYSTAENMLTRARVVARERVLVTGASGGVGSATIQLAAARGAEVAAVAGSDKHAALRAIGAGEVVDRETDLVAAFGADAFDVVIDVVGGSSWPSLLSVLRPGGRYATAGAIADPNVALDLRTMYLKDLTLFGCTVLDDGVFARLMRHVDQGSIKPLIAATFSLNEIVAAQQQFLAKRHVGKIVLTIQ
jgi:NADPH:quinone reductase-like Zn-dependent oxidoreductase